MKKLIALLLIVTIVGCKKKEDPQPEPQPQPSTTTGGAPTTKGVRLEIKTSASGTLNIIWDWDYQNQVMGSNYTCASTSPTYDYNNTIAANVDSMRFYFFTYTTTPTINYTLSVNNVSVSAGVVNTVTPKYLKY